MANRFFVVGGVDTNWGTVGNWSTTSGGSGGSSVPTAADAVTLDASSGSACTLNASARACLSLTTTNFTGTITFDQHLAVSGSITIGASVLFAGTGRLRMIAAGTWTTNGVTIPNDVEIGGSTAFTSTLADALTVSPGTLYLTNTTSTTFAGSFTLTAAALNVSGTQTVTLSDNIQVTNLTTIADDTVLVGAFSLLTGGLTTVGSLSGATLVQFNGTGTWIGAAGTLYNNLTINTTGILFLSGTIRYNTGTITHTAGTVSSGTSTLSLGGSTTLNTSTMDWANVAVTATAASVLTLNSKLIATGSFAGPDAPLTFGGSAGFDFGSIALALLTGTRVYTFLDAVQYIIRTLPVGSSVLSRFTLTISGGNIIVVIQRGAG